MLGAALHAGPIITDASGFADVDCPPGPGCTRGISGSPPVSDSFLAPLYSEFSGVQDLIPMVYTTVAIQPDSTWEAQASARLDYSFEFTGPQTMLPIDIVGIIQTTGTESPFSSAEWYAQASLQVDHTVVLASCNEAINANICGSTPILDGYFYQMMIPVNTQHAITMEANVNAPPGSSATASIDPYIYIDPSFGETSAFTLFLSDGVGNSPVPEPSTIGLVAAGIGSLLCRKRPRLIS